MMKLLILVFLLSALVPWSYGIGRYNDKCSKYKYCGTGYRCCDLNFCCQESYFCCFDPPSHGPYCCHQITRKIVNPALKGFNKAAILSCEFTPIETCRALLFVCKI
uniref:Cysteine rich secreted protein n=1 Tax=Riptortus pedestris TaxID=329032 RepID=R4WI72_RIPPE|nr:cysteine rich secreted protein [Riptortus pedestris]